MRDCWQISESREEALIRVRIGAYNNICGNLNRAERRTTKGRLLVIQAEYAALKAENDFLREELAQYRNDDAKTE